MFLQRFLSQIFAIHALIEALSAGRQPSPTLVKRAGLAGIEPSALRMPDNNSRRERQCSRDNPLAEPVMMVGGAAASVVHWATQPVESAFTVKPSLQ